MTDSAKMRYTTSPEVFGDSLAKLVRIIAVANESF